MVSSVFLFASQRHSLFVRSILMWQTKCFYSDCASHLKYMLRCFVFPISSRRIRLPGTLSRNNLQCEIRLP